MPLLDYRIERIQSKTMLIDFEHVEARVEQICNSPLYNLLVESVQEAEDVFIVANGGLHYVGSHLATDMCRLIPNRTFYSFDSFGFITSSANDYGYEQVFVRWLEATAGHKDLSRTLVLGLSCSGSSKNVVDALRWSINKGGNAFMIAGADRKPEDIPGLQMGFEYFHTVEVACMFLLYELIHRVGHDCPSIKSENLRNVNSSLRV
jgi:phosphoheptose isomerase